MIISSSFTRSVLVWSQNQLRLTLSFVQIYSLHCGNNSKEFFIDLEMTSSFVICLQYLPDQYQPHCSNHWRETLSIVIPYSGKVQEGSKHVLPLRVKGYLMVRAASPCVNCLSLSKVHLPCGHETGCRLASEKYNKCRQLYLQKIVRRPKIWALACKVWHSSCNLVRVLRHSSCKMGR